MSFVRISLFLSTCSHCGPALRCVARVIHFNVAATVTARLEKGCGPQAWEPGPTLLPGDENVLDLSVKVGRGATIVRFSRAGDPARLDGGCVQRVGQVDNGPAGNESLLVAILDVDVDDVDRTIEGAITLCQIIDDGVPATLLTGDDEVGDTTFGTRGTLVASMVEAWEAGLPVLEPLRTLLDFTVPSEHVENTVALVQAFIFALELLEHLVVGRRVEGVDVRLGGTGSRKPDERAGAKGDDWVASSGQTEMSLHGTNFGG